ncbi:flippase [Microcoleus sp. FACHB-68]|uniref:flippase n=1 Tax=Microcoleus sp. FACHB-68 TaxID=2692826 RepID=UPI001686B32A|nr:flippase [Microcoleus sp. FACHB-68]MBD1940405.1 flippase [Microcoleus sp. FACHB-68]
MLSKIATAIKKINPGQRQIIGNTGWLFASRILRLGLGLVVGVLLARYLGPEQFGLYNYTISFVVLFSPLATLGLDSIVIRDIVREPLSKLETLGTAFVLKLIGSFITFCLATGAIFFLRFDDNLAHWLVGLAAVASIFQAFDVIEFWFNSQIKSKYGIYAKYSAFIFVNVLRIVLIQMNASLIAFAWLIFIESLLSAVGLVIVYQASGDNALAWQVSIKRAKQLLKDSWPLLLSSISIVIYMRIDQVMLGELASIADIGNYSVAVRLVEVWYIIPMTLNQALFPSIVNLKKVAPETYEARIQRLYTLMIWMAIIAAILISYISSQLVKVIYGEQYIEAAPILSIQAWMATSVFFGVARASWVTTEGYLLDEMYVNIIGCILNVILNFILIPTQGAIGATVASLLTAFGANFIVAIYSKPIRISLRMYLISLLLPLNLLKKILCAV